MTVLDEFPARLDALRAELGRLGLDGFIVPRADEHQGEYVPPGSERLAWVSGFTGSAGLAVVLKDKAAIFVDGRYTLQAEAETPAGLFELCSSSGASVVDWIAENLGAKEKLGYDPWLMTLAQVNRYQAACEKADAEIKAVPENPLDAVWQDQPPPPTAAAIIHETAFAGVTAEAKRAEIADTLAGGKIDAAVLTMPDSIAWLLNIRGNDVPFSPLCLAFAVLNADASAELFIDGRKVTDALKDHLGPEVRCREPDDFAAALDTLGWEKKSVRLDPETAPAWVHQRLDAAGALIRAGADPCQLPKAKKNEVQLDGMRSAHRRDGASLTRFLAWLETKAGDGEVTEFSASETLESLRRDNEHFRGLSFATISGAGPNGAIVHYRVTPDTDRVLEPGTLYLVDSGAQYLDGTTDVTRTVAIGTPTDAMRRHFTLVLKGHIALATARFPNGTTGSQLDVLARRALWAEGLDYEHGTGHGVGHFLGVHEGPQRISKHPNRVALEPGMVVSNEPGYYETGAYGIRIENLVCVRSGENPANTLSFETLTLAPIDRALIDTTLMTPDETAWLDAYHARVRDEIAPLVDTDTKAWLERVTQPL
ncbi:MAG: aminopeptidase P family protein [Rhodospirillales bacterium]|nr:aminopeptidase P family protein [Alphaproteobacteria bacterium]MBL6948073.1 aminopeptidase P family protein [Rhodospirillales bacterium]